jgi:hypothetical protein
MGAAISAHPALAHTDAAGTRVLTERGVNKPRSGTPVETELLL